MMAVESQANEAVIPSSVPKVQEAPKRRWTSYIWDTFDKSPEERRLLFKLDTAILTFASLGKLKLNFILDLWLTSYDQVISSNIWIKSTSIMLLCLGCASQIKAFFTRTFSNSFCNTGRKTWGYMATS